MNTNFDTTNQKLLDKLLPALKMSRAGTFISKMTYTDKYIPKRFRKLEENKETYEKGEPYVLIYSEKDLKGRPTYEIPVDGNSAMATIEAITKVCLYGM